MSRPPVTAAVVIARPPRKPERVGRDAENPLEQILSRFLEIVRTDEHFRQQ
jgi:hypothetical protein